MRFWIGWTEVAALKNETSDSKKDRIGQQAVELLRPRGRGRELGRGKLLCLRRAEGVVQCSGMAPFSMG
jgi:hypothetical protein